ncbi:hypothetical protein JCM24511_04985 [Saitozyma sp. JCM 24511]|nr:hypothetical protein JCM24511_04985 [Saitozyma sp. JCM 24511]
MPAPASLPGLPDDYTPQFFSGDVVTKLMDPLYRGKVLRCWSDEEGNIPPPPPGLPEDPLERPLKRGEVGISDVSTGTRVIVPESSLLLYQREFLKGDVVKRSLVAVESAVIVDIKTEVQLEHIMSRERLRSWVPFDKLRNGMAIEARDKVIYDEWIGTVEEVFEDGLAEGRGGQCYRIAEMGGLLEPGRTVDEVLPKDAPGYNSSYPRFPPFADPPTDRIVDVRPVVVYITWNAINQELPISEQDSHPEPKKFWYGADLKKLTILDQTHASPVQLGTAVRFRDEDEAKSFGVKTTRHAMGLIKMDTLKVIESRSRVRLRWQDGTETEDWAKELVPYHNIDDYETWPGEHLVWRGDGDERRPAVVQSFNPHQRVAELLFMDTKEKGTVSVLELDPGGVGKANYGVGFGQQVLLCPDNGADLPEVPALGQFEPPIDNMWWRNELAKLAEQYADGSDEFDYIPPAGDPSAIKWWGEVTQLHLDGTVTVKLPGGEERRVEIKNVVLLNEPMGEPMDDGLGPVEGEDMDFVDDGYGSEASWETMSEGQGDQAHSPRSQAWNDESAEGDWDMRDEDESGAHDVEISDDMSARDAEEVEPMVTEPEIQVATMITAALPSVASPVAPSPSVTSPAALAPAPVPPSAEAGPSSAPNGHATPLPSLEDDEDWQRFEMLEEAPEDHRFFKEPAAAPSKAFNTRLQKEHRALMSSLPENILVRTYEDRMDLLRVLIIGPEGTPYNNAPFVFDVYLNPNKFPFEPPLVHFHSHTNGLGRCNPNLYEDGKVCLSVLGTWSGDKSESWNPTKSSLLQVFVSISGLVLVRSPYHCEPAFAKLEGTREGKVNSRLYSEKAYVLSRSFVRTALDRPPTGLEKEIKHFYLQRGRLQSVIDHARRLMDKGEADAADLSVGGDKIEEENAEMWNADAMGSLTMGAILTLKRTITALEKKLAESKQA